MVRSLAFRPVQSRQIAPGVTAGDTVEPAGYCWPAPLGDPDRAGCEPPPGSVAVAVTRSTSIPEIRPAVAGTGPRRNWTACCAALAGPGSGAPGRQRLADPSPGSTSLPTRPATSTPVDSRTVPTPAALAPRLEVGGTAARPSTARRERGSGRKRLALSAWGTANMRTGGDEHRPGTGPYGRATDPGTRQSPGPPVSRSCRLDVLDRPPGRRHRCGSPGGFPFRDALPRARSTWSTAPAPRRRRAGTNRPPTFNPLATGPWPEEIGPRPGRPGRGPGEHRRRAGPDTGCSAPSPGAYRGPACMALIRRAALGTTSGDLGEAFRSMGAATPMAAASRARPSTRRFERPAGPVSRRSCTNQGQPGTTTCSTASDY